MKKRNKILTIILVVFGVIILASAIAVKSMEANLNLLVQEEISDVDMSTAKDGVFTGNHKVLPVDVEVQVTVKNHAIMEILLVKHFNGQGKAAEVIPTLVLDTQSLQVDAVAGATYSSKIILKAIQSALLNAGATLVNP